MSAHAHAGVEVRVARRARARVEGTVQGVGFRPYVYRLADAHGLAGFVLNDTHGVLLEVEGSAGDVAGFLMRLPTDLRDSPEPGGGRDRRAGDARQRDL
jgi:hydrogenase maturation protein HypF